MPSERPLVLYIDDDPDYLDAVRAIVEATGYDMVGAGTAEEGLRLYVETTPDLMLVDLMMEEVDAGLSFVKAVQARGNTAPIYLLSSLGDALALTTDAEGLGLAGVLQKPLAPATLRSLLHARLDPTST